MQSQSHNIRIMNQPLSQTIREPLPEYVNLTQSVFHSNVSKFVWHQKHCLFVNSMMYFLKLITDNILLSSFAREYSECYIK
jgi:hypothetical protein